MIVHSAQLQRSSQQPQIDGVADAQSRAQENARSIGISVRSTTNLLSIEVTVWSTLVDSLANANELASTQRRKHSFQMRMSFSLVVIAGAPTNRARSSRSRRYEVLCAPLHPLKHGHSSALSLITLSSQDYEKENVRGLGERASARLRTAVAKRLNKPAVWQSGVQGVHSEQLYSHELCLCRYSYVKYILNG